MTKPENRPPYPWERGGDVELERLFQKEDDAREEFERLKEDEEEWT